MNLDFNLNQPLLCLLICLIILSSCGADEAPDLLEGVNYELLVSSRGTNSVKRYNGETGEYIDDLVLPGEGGLSLTQEVLISLDNQLIVSGRNTSAIKKYDLETGEYLGDFSRGFDLDQPVKMSFGPDNDIYISQWGENSSSVVRFDGQTGDFIAEVTPDLNQPMGQFFKGDTLHVVNFGSRDVRSFVNGELVEVVIGSSNLSGPVNLSFNGEMWLIEDWQDGAIKRFDTNGAFRGLFVNGLRNIEGTAIGPDGALYACDWGLSSIKKYDASTGKLIDVFVSDGDLSNPNSLLFRKR